jgi:hypothetical protein
MPKANADRGMGQQVRPGIFNSTMISMGRSLVAPDAK